MCLIDYMNGTIEYEEKVTGTPVRSADIYILVYINPIKKRVFFVTYRTIVGQLSYLQLPRKIIPRHADIYDTVFVSFAFELFF